MRVSCEGPGGISAPGEICTVTTEAIVPNPPQTPYCSNQPGPYAAVLRWDKPHYQGGAPVIDYELELEGVLNNGLDKKRQRVVAYRGRESYCVAKDLLPGENYTVQVRAINRIGGGSWSDEFSFKAGCAIPSKPLAPEITLQSPSQLTVEWHEPQINGASILDYKLESALKPHEEDAFSVIYEGLETKAELKNLLPHTTYYFRVYAVNSAGRSPNSPVVQQLTPAAAPNAPTFIQEKFEV